MEWQIFFHPPSCGDKVGHSEVTITSFPDICDYTLEKYMLLRSMLEHAKRLAMSRNKDTFVRRVIRVFFRQDT